MYDIYIYMYPFVSLCMPSSVKDTIRKVRSKKKRNDRITEKEAEQKAKAEAEAKTKEESAQDGSQDVGEGENKKEKEPKVPDAAEAPVDLSPLPKIHSQTD